MDSHIQRAMYGQENIFWQCYNIYYHGQRRFPAPCERGHSQENTTREKRPARLTGLGKNKGIPTNQKGSGKNQGYIKELYTRQVENLKRAAWAKKGYPGGLKT